MTAVVGSDILASLGSAREKVEHHLAGMSRYRALLAIEQTISELNEFPDLAQPLGDVRDQVRHQLNDTREYRALCAIESIAPQLNDVLIFLREASDGGASNADTALSETSSPEAAGKTPLIPMQSHADELEPASDNVSRPQRAAEPADASDAWTQIQSEDVSNTFGAPLDIVTGDVSHDVTPGHRDADGGDGISPDSEESSEEPPSPPVATLAYNLANMLVQSLPPNQGDARASDSRAETEEATNADPSMQEGRAA